MFGKMFEKEAKEQSQKHLKLFHYFIPVLLMNFVEKMLIFKDRLAKKQVDDVLLAVNKNNLIFYLYLNKG